MSKNYMAGVAQLLGVELGEVFRIDGDEHYFRLTDIGLRMSIGSDNKNWLAAPINALNGLLLGKNEIIKLSWKPKENEAYYMPAIDNDSYYRCAFWKDSNSDKRWYYRGLAFKTKEEAIEMTQRMMEVAEEVRNDD